MGLNNAKIFSKINFRSGYYQIPLRECDREKTAFRVGNNLFHFNVMPFGLHTAAQTFMRLMGLLFDNIPFVKVYVDDVNEHLGHLEEVFNIISTNNLTINRDKCEFFQRSIEYLGFIIADNQIKPSRNKIDCVMNFPVPSSKKELKSFLGLANAYRSLIANYAEETSLLYDLLKNKNKFVWSDKHQSQFEKLKNILIGEPVLRIPDLSKRFIVRTDASNLAMGAVLQQEDDEGNRYVVEYFSKKFNNCQMRYSTIEKEATGLKAAIDKWSIYLKGKKFSLETDHRPLVWLKSMMNKNSKLSRMALELQEYDFDVSHISGVANSDADALFRIECGAISFDDLSKDQLADPKLVELWKKNPECFPEKNSILYFRQSKNHNWQLCIPQSHVRKVLRLCHDDMGHEGQHKTLDLVTQRFYWPGRRNDVIQFIKKCDCQLKKPRPAVKVKLCTTDIMSYKVVERLQIDIMTFPLG